MTCKYLKVCFHKWIDVVQKNAYETVIVLVFLILTLSWILRRLGGCQNFVNIIYEKVEKNEA